MSFSPLTQQLIDAMCALPGIGPKSAQRLAFKLLGDTGKTKGLHLAHALKAAMDQVGHCQRCRNYTELSVCELCNSAKRNAQLLCVVESPADLVAIEQTASYNGLYFVLQGHLSPLEGIGPEDLALDALLHRIRSEGINEVILATNSTMEGEATAQYIAAQIDPSNITCTRIAHGVPMGGELEYIDGGTLGHAFTSRVRMNQQEVT